MKKLHSARARGLPLLICLLIAAAAVILAAVLLWVRRPAAQLELPYLTARCALVAEADSGQVCYEKDADRSQAPGSITKLMAVLLVLEDIRSGVLDWGDTATVTEAQANAPGSRFGLAVGEQPTVRQLVAGALLSSGCDCVQCLVQLCADSEPAFVERMNRRAAELGLHATRFVNATGIDAEGHCSTARDIANLCRFLTAEYPEILDFTAAAELTDGDYSFHNTNLLIGSDPRVLGLKTGTTDAGGCNLAVYARTAEGDVIVVLLDCASDYRRFSETERILDALEGTG